MEPNFQKLVLNSLFEGLGICMYFYLKHLDEPFKNNLIPEARKISKLTLKKPPQLFNFLSTGATNAFYCSTSTKKGKVMTLLQFLTMNIAVQHNHHHDADNFKTSAHFNRHNCSL